MVWHFYLFGWADKDRTARLMTTGIIAGTLALQKGTEKEIETEVAIGEIAIGITTVIRTEVEEIETVIGIETGVPTVTGEPCAAFFVTFVVDSALFSFRHRR